MNRIAKAFSELPAQPGRSLDKKSPVGKADCTANPTGLSLYAKSAHSTRMKSFPKIILTILESYFSGKIDYSEVHQNEKTNFNK